MRTSRPLPSKISAVVSDVDGTLVDDDKMLSVRAQKAVTALRAQKIAFTIVSARPPRGLRSLVDALGIETPVVAFNGGVIATPALSPLAQHLLPVSVARRAVEMLNARGIQVWIFSGQDWLLRDPGGAYTGLETKTVGFQPTVVPDFAPALGSVAKIVGVSADFAHLAQCEREIRDALAGEATVARSQPYYLDITHPDANKGVALTELARLLAIPLEEIAVIGDGANDVAMFARSGFAIAMGNGSLQVQQAADAVTGSNCDDGFADAIERFILGRARPNAPLAAGRTGERA